MNYEERLTWLKHCHGQLIEKKNYPIEGNGVYERYENPVVTAERTVFLTVAVILICTALSVGAIAYFNYAAKTDAEKWKLMDRE